MSPPGTPRSCRADIGLRRRHVITDCLGLRLMVLVCAADVTDRQAARVMLPRLRARFHRITPGWADDGYTGRPVTWANVPWGG